MKNMKNIVYYFSKKYLGNWENIYNAIYTKEEISESDLNAIVLPKNMINIVDDNYFECFKKMYMPPFCLFYKGNLELLNKKIIGFLVDEINKKDINRLKENNDLVFCISEKNLNDTLIDLITKNKINLIVIKQNLNNFKDIINENVLYLSEFNSVKIDIAPMQTIDRLVYSVSNEINLRSEEQLEIEYFFKNYYVHDYKKVFLQTHLDIENIICALPEAFQFINFGKSNIETKKAS